RYLDRVAEDDDITVVLLRGAEGVFSTGADMNNAYGWYGDERSREEQTGDERSREEQTGDERSREEQTGDERRREEQTAADEEAGSRAHHRGGAERLRARHGGDADTRRHTRAANPREHG